MAAVGMTVKEGREGFLDRPKVIALIGRERATILLGVGWKIRNEAVRSIRNRDYGNTSAPGSPPYSHVGYMHEKEQRRRRRAGLPKLEKLKGEQRGIKAIEFRYDFSSQSVVVGAIKFDSSTQDPTVPNLLEFGGVRVIRRPIEYGKTGRRTGGGNLRMMHYAPRPYMGPALLKVQGTSSPMWTGAVA